jgi:hypothetical protein
MKTASTLLKYRLRSIRHAGGSRGGRGLAAGVVVIAGVLAATGWMAHDSLIESSSAWTAQMGRAVMLPGLRALEVAFWAAAFLASIQCFRVMELLFRREDILALSLLPVPTSGLLAERTATAVVEAIIFGLVGSSFFAVLLLSHPLVFLLCATLLIGGLVASSCITLGVVMWFGGQYGHPDAKVGGDAYGGTGAAFIYAPGAALAGSLVVLVLLQLALGEVLKAGSVTRAFWMGIGLVGVASLVGIATARREFPQFHLIAAWFREADTVGFTTDVEYQTTRWEPTFLEKFVKAPLPLRRTWIQLRRHNMVSDNVESLLYAGALISSWWLIGDGMTPFFIAPMIVTLTIHPWRRAEARVLGNAAATTLPITLRDEIIATTMYISWDIVKRSAAYGGVLALVSWHHGLQSPWIALAAFFTPLALQGVYTALWVVSRQRPGALVPVITAAILTAVAVWSIPTAAVLCGLLSILSFSSGWAAGSAMVLELES